MKIIVSTTYKEVFGKIYSSCIKSKRKCLCCGSWAQEKVIVVSCQKTTFCLLVGLCTKPKFLMTKHFESNGETTLQSSRLDKILPPHKIYSRNYGLTHSVINRPGVAGAVLQSPPSLINSVSDPLVKISSKHSQSQTGRARVLKF